MTSDLDVRFSVTSPRRTFGEVETFHWWAVAVEEETLSISSGGVYVGPNGSDSFTTMRWTAFAGGPSDLDDYLATLWMVPDVQSFPAAVASIDFTSRAYRVEIHDEDNPLLADDDEDDESDEDEDDPEVEEEDETEDDADEQDHEPWVVAPCNDAERTLAATIIPPDVDANEPVYSNDPGNCGFCGCVLDQRGLFRRRLSPWTSGMGQYVRRVFRNQRRRHRLGEGAALCPATRWQLANGGRFPGRRMKAR